MKTSNHGSAPQAKRGSRWGLLIWSILGLLLGTIPFALGAFAQAASRSRLPGYGTSLLGAIVYLVLWRLTGYLPFRYGEGPPLWPSVVLSLLLFVAFFAGGGAVFREFKDIQRGGQTLR